MAPLLNSPFTSIQRNYFSFKCQSGDLRRIYPTSARRKKWRGLSPFQKNIATAWIIYPDLIHIYSWDPWFWTSYLSLFQFFCHGSLVLSRRRVQKEFGVPNWVGSWPEDLEGQIVKSRWNYFVEGRDYVALGPLYVSSYTWQEIKIFTIIEWMENKGTLLYITPHSIA